jgi:hypothetical protein
MAPRHFLADFFQGVQTVDIRQPHVHQHDVRLVFPGLGNRLGAADGFGDNRDASWKITMSSVPLA